MPIQSLPFDSDLFGYPVGKFMADEEVDWDNFLNESSQYQLVYVFSESGILGPPEFLRFVNSRYVFGKKITAGKVDFEIDLKFRPYSGPLTNQLLSLAFQSGEYSRFKTDPRLSAGEFEKLYTSWIEKALKEDLVLASPDQTAMVTLTVSGSIAKIGLIAVDSSCRGSGVGKALLKAAESAAVRLGARSMEIPTQGENLGAVKFYENNDYKLIGNSMIYHFFNLQKVS